MDIGDEIGKILRATEEPNESESEWLITSDAVVVVSDFEMLSEQVRRVISDPHRWKWVIIALHSGIQGMMVLALKGSNGLNALREKDKGKWLDWHNGIQSDVSRPRDMRLADFLELYKRIKGDQMLLYTRSQKFVPQGTQGKSIKTLNRLRNKLIHFTPKVWAHELGGLSALVSDGLEIAKFLAWESGNVFLEQGLEERLRAAFESVRKSLTALRHGE